MRVVKKKEKEICVDELDADKHIVLLFYYPDVCCKLCYTHRGFEFLRLDNSSGWMFPPFESFSEACSYVTSENYELHSFETQKEFAEFLLGRS